MALSAESRDVILAACQVGADEASEALSRALDQDLKCNVAAEQPSCELPAGPGLVVLMDVEGVGAAFVISTDSGLLPDWYATPDATGESKLTTLAQELGMILLPEDLMPMDFKAAAVPDVVSAIAAGDWQDNEGCVALELTASETTAIAWLLFPLTNGEAVFAESMEVEHTSADAPAGVVTTEAPSQAAASPSPPVGEVASRFTGSMKDLPSYTRSLLKIRVPLQVTLAKTKLPISRIVELGPGSIIQFNKRCEETLTLEVGEHEVAEGEAVKIGEKFGLRITSMKLPDERFWIVKKKLRVS